MESRRVNLNSIALFPVVGMLGIGAIQGGGAEPGAADSAPPVALSANLVPFGGAVTASGAARSLPVGSRITVLQRPDRSAPMVLGRTRVDRRHRWSVRFRATAEGQVVALGPAGSARPASAAAGSRLDMSIVVPVPDTVGGRPGASTPVAVALLPRLRAHWTLEHRGRSGWRTVGAGISDRNGRLTARLAVGTSVHSYRIRVASASGLNGSTSRVIRSRGLRPAVASWYGLYGDPVACGGVLRRNQLGVAHKTLPCGTKVTIRYHGRTVVAPVIDRGPFIRGREFDLTGAVARRLHFDGVGVIWVSP